MNTIQISKQENFAIVQLNRGSANAINLELLEELNAAFKTLATDETISGVVLTGKPNFFSAGLDVIELYNYDEVKIEDLFDALFETMKTMLSFEKPLVASITGHAPAGGCILAICTDYRVMAEGKYRIGLNEIPVGIMMPTYIFETYAFWLGKGKAYQYILEGKLATTEEALNDGLVNSVVAAEDVLNSSIAQLKKYMALSANTWSKSKMIMRADLLKFYSEFNTDLKAELLKGWWSKETRAILGALVAKLTKK